MRTKTYSWQEALSVYGVEKEYNSIEQELSVVKKDKYLYGKLVVATSLVLTISATVATGGWSSIMPLNLKMLLELMDVLKVALHYSFIIVAQIFMLIACLRGTLKDMGHTLGNIICNTFIITLAVEVLEAILLSL